MPCQVNVAHADLEVSTRPRYRACGSKTACDVDGVAMCERHALEHWDELIIDEPYDPGVPGRACLLCKSAWPASEADEEPWHHTAKCPLWEGS